MRLIDSHAHLQADRFARDRTAVVVAARAAGVERILVPGWDLASSRNAIDLARSESLDAAVGVHPHVSSGIDDGTWTEISHLAEDSVVVAVGETGLDYDRGFSPRAAQLAALRGHIALALEMDKPLVVHCRSRAGDRDAHDDLLRELSRAKGSLRLVLHSFSGPLDYAERALGLGAFISFSGLVFRAGEETSAEVGRLVPPDRVLVETDSPYLSPTGAPKRRNEPRWVEITARWLAEQRRIDTDALGELLIANYERAFGRRP
jgi:TatD DNase family protein